MNRLCCRSHDFRPAGWRAPDEFKCSNLFWVHWFNTNRVHSCLDYATPIEYEDQ